MNQKVEIIKTFILFLSRMCNNKMFNKKEGEPSFLYLKIVDKFLI